MRKFFFPAALALAALAALAALVPVACARHAAGHFGELSLDEVARRLGTPGFYLFDNNTKETWEREHLPGAKWVDYANVRREDLPADKEATLVFYCANEH